MNTQKENIIKTKLLPLYAFILAFLLLLLLFFLCGIAGYGNNTILSGNLYHRQIAYIQSFLNALRGNDSFWYSFSLGLGHSTATVYAYYCLSPFHLLYLLPGISVSAMTLFILLLKLSLAAASAEYYFMKLLKNEQPYTILFATAYALSAFALTLHGSMMWLDALYLLPILLVKIHELVKNGRFLMLSLLYALLFLTNFQFGYITGIFSLLFFAVLLYLHHPPFKPGALTILKFLLALLLGLGMSSVILLPVYCQHSGSSPSLVSLPDIICTLPDILGNLFIGASQGIDSPIPLLYCGLPTLLLLLLYYKEKKIPKKEKIAVSTLLLLYLLGMQFRFFSSLLSGPLYEGNTAFRFSFCLILLFLTMALRAFSFHEEEIPVSKLLILAGILLIFYAVMTPYQLIHLSDSPGNTQALLIINAVFLLSYILLYCIRGSKKVAVFFSLLWCAEMIVNGWYCISRNTDGYISENDINSATLIKKTAVDTVLSADPDLYRLRLNGETMENAPSFYHYPGAVSSFPALEQRLSDTLSALGIRTNSDMIYDHGYTPVTQMLLSMRYELTPEGTLRIAPAALPIGYMVSTNILAWQPAEDPFLNQENLVNCMTDGDYHFFVPIPADSISMRANNMERIPINDNSGFQLTDDTQETGNIFFTVNAPSVYACLTTAEDYECTEKAPAILCESAGISREDDLSGNAIVKLVQNGNDTSELILRFGGSYASEYLLGSSYFYLYDPAMLESACQDLQSGGLTVSSWSDGSVSGTVTATEDRPILFTSIPYEKGWNAYVDGIPITPLVSASGTFLSLFLSPGTHEVCFQYETPGYLPGMLISGLSLIAVLLFLLYSRKKTAPTKADPNPKQMTDVSSDSDAEASNNKEEQA